MSGIITENIHEGALYIDREQGVISFLDNDGNRLLRITHLPTPVPPNIMVDVTAIRNLTSYTPIRSEDDSLRTAPAGAYTRTTYAGLHQGHHRRVLPRQWATTIRHR
jgi:hypothetical protein